MTTGADEKLESQCLLEGSDGSTLGDSDGNIPLSQDLARHGIALEPSKTDQDPPYRRLERIVQTTTRECTVKVPELKVLLTQTIEQLHEDPERFNEIEQTLRTKLEEVIGFPILSSKYLKSYQRNTIGQWTLIMLIFPLCDERLRFTGTSWELWPDHCLLCEPKLQPRPAFTLGFALKTLVANPSDPSDPIPEELLCCLSPIDNFDLCFPFMFVEVVDTHPDEAKRKILHSTSQGLYNIYLFMAQAGRIDQFFSDVRLFSFVFNGENLSVRIHRAEKSDGSFCFRFDNFHYSETKYTYEGACLLVRSLLKDYVFQSLLPILKEAFQLVVEQECCFQKSRRSSN